MNQKYLIATLTFLVIVLFVGYIYIGPPEEEVHQNQKMTRTWQDDWRCQPYPGFQDERTDRETSHPLAPYPGL
jgi:hypothetical protein